MTMIRFFALLLALCTFLPASAGAQDASRSDWHGLWVATDGNDTLSVELGEKAVYRFRESREGRQLEADIHCFWSIVDSRLRIEACTKVEAWTDPVERDDYTTQRFSAYSDEAEELTDLVRSALDGARRAGPALILAKDGETLIYERQ